MNLKVFGSPFMRYNRHHLTTQHFFHKTSFFLYAIQSYAIQTHTLKLQRIFLGFVIDGIFGWFGSLGANKERGSRETNGKGGILEVSFHTSVDGGLQAVNLKGKCYVSCPRGGVQILFRFVVSFLLLLCGLMSIWYSWAVCVWVTQLVVLQWQGICSLGLDWILHCILQACPSLQVLLGVDWGIV